MNLRKERIERLLEELRYEIQRGMMDREIEESLGFRFIVPISNEIPNGVVLCEFRTRPMPSYNAIGFDDPGKARLRVVK